MTSPLQIDGSFLEGGGQILRMSMGYSALLRKPIQICNIRGNRTKPGLQGQHLAGLILVKDLSLGQLTGAALQSSSVEFRPSVNLEGGSLKADTGTAGATTLLAQISLPCLLFASQPSSVDLRGGTNADFAPSIDFYQRVFRPNLQRFGVSSFDCDLVRKGYFPRGGGQVLLKVEPINSLSAVELLNAGSVKSVEIEASVAGTLPLKVAEEMAEAARKMLHHQLRHCRDSITVKCFKEQSAVGNGSSIIIRVETSTGCILGGSAIGSPKKKPSDSGKEAAEDVLQSLEVGACVDQWTQDQLIIYMALAKGKSKIRTGPLTLHTETAIYISQVLSDARFEVKKEGSTTVIECDGIGYER